MPRLPSAQASSTRVRQRLLVLLSVLLLTPALAAGIVVAQDGEGGDGGPGAGPTLVGTAPTGTASSATPTISATLEGGPVYEYRILLDGLVRRTYAAPDDGPPLSTGATLAYTPPSALAAGAHTVEVILLDNMANEYPFTWGFTVPAPPPPPPPRPDDVQRPTVIAWSPLGPHEGGVPEIAVDYRDDKGVNASRIRAFVDEVEVTAFLERTATRLRFVPAETLAVGNHTVYVLLYDDASNMRIHLWTFEVTPPPPDVEAPPPPPPPETQESVAEGGVARFVYAHPSSTLVGVAVSAAPGAVVNLTARTVEAPPVGFEEPRFLRLAYYEVSVASPLVFDGAEVTFRVPKAWLSSAGANASDVVALGPRGGAWAPMAISLLTETEKDFVFRTASSSLPLLAVGADVDAPVIVKTIPGDRGYFGVLPVMAFRAEDAVGINWSSARAVLEDGTPIELLPLGDGAPAVTPTPRPPLPEGRHVVTFSVADLVGHVTTQRFIVSQDLRPPEIIPVYGEAAEGPAVPVFEFWAHDDQAGLDIFSLNVTIDDAPAAVTRTPDGFKVSPAAPLLPGLHTYLVRLNDRSGNTATFERFFFVTEKAAPQPPDPVPPGNVTPPRDGNTTPPPPVTVTPTATVSPAPTVSSPPARTEADGTLPAPSAGLVGLLVAAGVGIILLARRPQ